MRNVRKGPAAAFVEDKGFYMILLLCVVAILVSAYVLFFSPAQQTQSVLDTAVYEPTVLPEDVQPVLGSEQDVPVIAPEESTQESTPTQAVQQQDTSSATQAVAQPSAPAFVRPVAGAVMAPYSGDELVYQATFGDWRTHDGTDYTASIGARVYAITDGTVEDVYTDGLYGTCVTLSHADGLQSTYKGLGEKVKVSAGQSVKAGDVLGTVDDTNLAEAAQEAHLHVEVTQNGQRIDPETLLTDTSE